MKLKNNYQNEEGYSCEICGAFDFSLLFDRERNGEDIRNYICENCGFVFIYPRPAENQLKTLYQESEFSKTARGLTEPDAKKYHDCEKAALIRYSEFKGLIERIPPLTSGIDFFHKKGAALDIGTGTGSFVDVLISDGWQAEGLDPDTAYAENVEKHYSIFIHKIPLEDFANPQGRKYNLLTAFNVLEHVLQPVQFFQRMGELLSENGVVYIDMPGLDKMYTDVDKFFWKPHINTFSISSLRVMLECCGFKANYIGYSQLGFLMAIAQKNTMRNNINKPYITDVYNLKSIVDSAYSPFNKNAETLFLHPESLLKQ